MTDSTDAPAGRSKRDRWIVLAASLSAWAFAGMQMGLLPLVARAATKSLLGGGKDAVSEAVIGEWFAWFTCAFLLGAAAGGLVFGWMGDRWGRARALAASVLCYSVLAGACGMAQSLEQLLVLRFLACMGIGGVWPNGIALASEAWSEVSRPTMAGLFGTAANVGQVSIGLLGAALAVTSDNWRTVMWCCAAPAPLGLLIWLLTPESPDWLKQSREPTAPQVGVLEVFRPPWLRLTIIGILLGAIPLFGNWSGGNWLVPWADQAAETAARAEGADSHDATLKARTQIARSAGATIGGLIGGWLASLFGRRLVYFLISLGSFAVSEYIFYTLTPLDGYFIPWVFALGFVTTIYFGWLPLYLPELFPTRVRSTGSGVTFNFGRILTAFGVLGAGVLMRQGIDYPSTLAITAIVYALGMVVIWWAPDNAGKRVGA